MILAGDTSSPLEDEEIVDLDRCQKYKIISNENAGVDKMDDLEVDITKGYADHQRVAESLHGHNSWANASPEESRREESLDPRRGIIYIGCKIRSMVGLFNF